jgi:CelD/BcsL family acetyltransferase involved in cellulose biosynthesis
MLKLQSPPYEPLAPVAPAARNGHQSALEDSLFLSRSWMQSCIDNWTGRTRYRQLRLPAADGTSAIALLGDRLERRHGLLPVRVLALNQSGCDVLDQPWIERNGFFGANPNAFESHLTQLLDLLRVDPRWDELRLGGLTSNHARQALYQAARYGLNARLDLEQPSFNIDLDAVRSQFSGDYLKALSPNTRQQLRRSRRLAEATLGPLTLDSADSVKQALAWFDETSPLHRARWGGPDHEVFDSGFDNPAFVQFHQGLIRHAFPEGGIQYLRLRAGQTVLAYLYNFVAGRNVHFYLSGIDYRHDATLRPGMLAHWMAIEANLAAGMQLYDFLAGDARYKRSLSTGEDRTLWLVLQRPRLKLQLEAWARKAKRKWRGQSQDVLDRIPHPSRVRS